MSFNANNYNELKYFLSGLISNGRLFLIFKFYFGVMFDKIYFRIFKSKYKRYPLRARAIYSYGQKYYSPQIIPQSTDLCIPFNFTFKTSLIEKKILKNSTWEQLHSKEDDLEVQFSINRWYWLIYDYDSVSGLDVHETLCLVRSWAAAHPYHPSHTSWEAYSASERISSLVINLIIKIPITELKILINSDKILHQFVNNTAFHLSKNLEYYPRGVTFNHVVNDLKGIVIGSLLLDDTELLESSFSLLLQELSIVVDEDGFLREGSSHYQFILTKWLCDLGYIFYRSKQIILLKKLFPQLEKCMGACAFFISGSSRTELIKMPLFGDISPDFDPEWISEYFRSALSVKNTARSGNYGDDVMKALSFDNKYLFVDNHVTTNNFTRISQGPWIIFVSHSANEGTFYPNHAHEDFTSYIIYVDGKELVVDPGRDNYQLPPLYDPFCQSQSHNVIQVNNLPMAVSSNHFYLPDHYKQTAASREIDVKSEQISLTLTLDSLRPSGKKQSVFYSRIFTVSSDGIDVHDHVSSEVELLNISAQIFISENYSIDRIGNNKFKLTNRDGFSVDLQTSQSFDSNADFYRAERYNSTTKISKLSLALQHTSVSSISVRYTTKSE